MRDEVGGEGEGGGFTEGSRMKESLLREGGVHQGRPSHSTHVLVAVTQTLVLVARVWSWWSQRSSLGTQPLAQPLPTYIRSATKTVDRLCVYVCA